MNRITALILDWAGTTVDFGSFAPTQIFVEAFRQAFDIELTLEEDVYKRQARGCLSAPSPAGYWRGRGIRR